jgi:hypothetical protein
MVEIRFEGCPYAFTQTSEQFTQGLVSSHGFIFFESTVAASPEAAAEIIRTSLETKRTETGKNAEVNSELGEINKKLDLELKKAYETIRELESEIDEIREQLDHANKDRATIYEKCFDILGRFIPR